MTPGAKGGGVMRAILLLGCAATIGICGYWLFDIFGTFWFPATGSAPNAPPPRWVMDKFEAIAKAFTVLCIIAFAMGCYIFDRDDWR